MIDQTVIHELKNQVDPGVESECQVLRHARQEVVIKSRGWMAKVAVRATGRGDQYNDVHKIKPDL